jgi:hypothetical protein
MKDREWKTEGPVLLGIHASKKLPTLTDEELDKYFPSWREDDTVEIGAVLGVVDLLGIYRAQDLAADLRDHEFTNRDDDNWCWVLAKPRKLNKPFDAPGNARLFRVDVPDHLMPSDVKNQSATTAQPDCANKDGSEPVGGPEERAVKDAKPIPTIFSWGYYGWGNATARLVEAVDAIEHSRGFKPPLFVDIRIQRTGRAEGFKGTTFEKLLGPERYKWMKSLGNLAVKTREGRLQIADPSAAEELLVLAIEGAEQKQRVLFFCGCEFPRRKGTRACHRDEVSRLILKAARKRNQRIEVVEWPGEEPAQVEPEMTAAEFKQLQAGRQTIAIGQSVDADMCGLPWGSIATARSDDQSMYVVTGPARFQRGKWQLPVLGSAPADVSFEEVEDFSAEFREGWGMNPRNFIPG